MVRIWRSLTCNIVINDRYILYIPMVKLDMWPKNVKIITYLYTERPNDFYTIWL